METKHQSNKVMSIFYAVGEEKSPTQKLFTVYFKHLRDDPKGKKIRKYDYPKMTVEFTHMRGNMTLCILRIEGIQTPYSGVAIRHSNDKEDIRFARKLALSRAAVQYISSNIESIIHTSDKMTRQIWDTIRLSESPREADKNFIISCAREIDESNGELVKQILSA